MGGGNASMRIEAGALNHVLNESKFGRGTTFVVERRMGDALLPAGVFGDLHSAAEAIDQAVGTGDGTEEDYEIVVYHPRFRHRTRWLWAAAVTVVVIWFLVLLAIAFWPR